MHGISININATVFKQRDSGAYLSSSENVLTMMKRKSAFSLRKTCMSSL